MGARTNYTIVTTNDPAQNINVYSHWDGHESVSIMQSALLAARPRYSDTPYAVRIIIDQLTKNGRDSETGYGIYIGDSIQAEEEFEYKEIDLVTRTVTVGQMVFTLDEFTKVLV